MSKYTQGDAGKYGTSKSSIDKGDAVGYMLMVALGAVVLHALIQYIFG